MNDFDKFKKFFDSLGISFSSTAVATYTKQCTEMLIGKIDPIPTVHSTITLNFMVFMFNKDDKYIGYMCTETNNLTLRGETT